MKRYVVKVLGVDRQFCWYLGAEGRGGEGPGDHRQAQGRRHVEVPGPKLQQVSCHISCIDMEIDTIFEKSYGILIMTR